MSTTSYRRAVDRLNHPKHRNLIGRNRKTKAAARAFA